MRNLVAFVILSLAVAGSWWLARRATLEEDSVTQTDAGGPTRGFYLRDAVLSGNREDGQTQFELTARRLDQNLTRGGVDARELHLTLHEEEGAPWRVDADNGSIPADQSSIQLQGNILARRDQPEPAFVLRTQSLRLLPRQQVAETEELVTITFGDQKLTAVGMRAYFKEDRVELQSKVHGQFTP